MLSNYLDFRTNRQRPHLKNCSVRRTLVVLLLHVEDDSAEESENGEALRRNSGPHHRLRHGRPLRHEAETKF